MEENTNETKVTITIVLLAIGVIVPYFTSHLFGIEGTVLLPIHIPVLLCGLLCGPVYGVVAGVLIPVLGSMFTGMPHYYPMLPLMVIQLAGMGGVSGAFYQWKGQTLYLSLFSAVIIGWLLYGIVFIFLTVTFGSELETLSMTEAIVKGLPGMIFYLVLIPMIMKGIIYHRKWITDKI